VRTRVVGGILLVVAFSLFAGNVQAYEVGIRVVSLHEADPDLVVTLKVAQKDLTGTQLIYRWYRWPDYDTKELVAEGTEDTYGVSFRLERHNILMLQDKDKQSQSQYCHSV